ncbi:MAG: hypothetical protein RR009_08810, partial [Oscillospiraceae bacterium]
MDTSLIDLDRIPTLEELRAFFRDNDWSAAQLSDPEERDMETVEAIEYVKSIMDEHFDPLAHENGLPKKTACYGKDNPLIALRNNSEDLVASAVVKMIDEQPDVVAEILDCFDLSDPDLDQKSDDFLDNAVRTMLDTMNYAGAAKIVTDNPAFEDFSKLSNNHAKERFQQQYYRTRTKNPTVSLEEVTMDGLDESMLPNTAEADLNAKDSAEVVRAFWKTLDEDEKQLIIFRMNNLTYEEIAEKLGLKTHTAVIKRRRKIKDKYEDFFRKYEG